jgi:kynurenine formamidase
MRRIIDLSTPIVDNHFRWKVDRELKKSYSAGDELQVTWAGWVVHGFTHMDTPRHFDPKGFTTDDVSLDMTVGEAAVVDLSHIEPNTAIDVDLVEKAGAHVREGDIVLMRTGWDLKRSNETPEFWTEAPYMTREASEWLLGRKIKAIAYDFPQDYCIRHYVIGDRQPALEENTTHMVLLCNGVLMFEYLCNMMAIESERTFFVGLPLKLPDSDGSPVRAVAIEGI